MAAQPDMGAATLGANTTQKDSIGGNLKLISYNLEKHRASGELTALLRSTGATSLCIQEARASELPETVEGLSLVASTPQNRLGLAIYADLERYELEDSFMRSFRKSLHDLIAAPAEHRLLAAVLRDRESGEISTLASFHGSPLTSANGHRRRQIAQSLGAIEAMAPEAPLLMAGDYNYPIFREGLSRGLALAGYELSFSDTGTYERSLIRGHFDFVTSRGYEIRSVRTLPRGASDHRPILVDYELRDGKLLGSLETTPAPGLSETPELSLETELSPELSSAKIGE